MLLMPLTYALLKLGLWPSRLCGNLHSHRDHGARTIIGSSATVLYVLAWFLFAIGGGWAVSLWF